MADRDQRDQSDRHRRDRPVQWHGHRRADLGRDRGTARRKGIADRSGGPSVIPPMQEFIFDAIAFGGYWGILVLMAVENVFPPIPSEVIMGIGGVLVARGTMEFWPLIFAGTVGSTAGNYVWYWVGDRYGYKRLKP